MSECKDKHKYNTEKQANRARYNLWANVPGIDIEDVHVYPCPQCGKFHVGHWSKYLARQEMSNET